MDLRSKSRKRDVVSFAQAYGWRSDAACFMGLRSKSRMRDVVRRATPPFPAVLNKFIFKGSRGEYVSLLPQEPENVLRPGLICRRQQIDKSTKFGLPWPTRSHPPAPPRPTPRAQDQVATLPLSGSFRCYELPFSRRGWPWCCTKFLFWGALEGDRLAALRRTGTVRTRGWVLSWR